MSYQALARTWRPKSFSQMVGQEHVVKALSNALTRQRLHHAYLFTGTRGVGKTTLARIFAKALNCEQGPTATPCGQCHSCQEIDQGNQVDLIEVDAASRTRVDQTRELLDNVQYRPVSSRYKIYLIDEVHMFSTSSFNALLKTLEEPPEHVKFLLATTDPKKCPVTVLSRCLQFNLHPLPQQKIAAHLEYILGQENIDYESNAVVTLAAAANGSVRDALSLLDQAIAYSDQCISEQNIVAMLGGASRSSLVELMQHLAGGDANACLDIVAAMHRSSVNLVDALDQLTGLFHQLGVYQLTARLEDEMLKAPFEQLLQQWSAEEIQLNYQILIDGKRHFIMLNDHKAGFEMLMLRMIAFRPVEQMSLQATPRAGHQPARQENIVAKKAPAPAGKQADVAPTAAVKALPEVENKINKQNWHHIVSQLGVKAITRQLAENCIFEKVEQGTLFLSLPEHFAVLLNSDIHKKLQAAIKQYDPAIQKLKITLAAKQDSKQATPAQIQQQKVQDEQEQLQQAFLNEPMVQALQQDMAARVIQDSIERN